MTKHTLDNLAADGSTSGRRIYNSSRGEPNTLTFFVTGTFGAGTVTLETSPDSGTTWVSVGSDGEFTADGQVDLILRSDPTTPLLVRATIAGSTTPDVDTVFFDMR